MYTFLSAHPLHRYRCLYPWVTLVVPQLKVLILEVVNVPHFRVEIHRREIVRLPRYLHRHLPHVVTVNVQIPEGVNKLTQLQVTYLGNHHGKERIRGDVKG